MPPKFPLDEEKIRALLSASKNTAVIAALSAGVATTLYPELGVSAGSENAHEKSAEVRERNNPSSHEDGLFSPLDMMIEDFMSSFMIEDVNGYGGR